MLINIILQMNKNDFYNGTLKARFIPKDEFIANRDIDT
jgi:hypothetical protein